MQDSKILELAKDGIVSVQGFMNRQSDTVIQKLMQVVVDGEHWILAVVDLTWSTFSDAVKESGADALNCVTEFTLKPAFASIKGNLVQVAGEIATWMKGSSGRCC